MPRVYQGICADIATQQQRTLEIGIAEGLSAETLGTRVEAVHAIFEGVKIIARVEREKILGGQTVADDEVRRVTPLYWEPSIIQEGYRPKGS
jgi:hypothetical protein